MASPTNRRRHPRAKAKGVAAHIQTEGGLTSCVVENISQGGLFVRTAHLLPVGIELTLSLVRPGMKRALKLKGRVVSALQNEHLVGMGVQFSSPDGEETQRLGALLRELGVPEEVVPSPSSPASPEANGQAPQAQATAPDAQRLMLQIQGLLMQLGEVQARLDEKEREVERLTSALEERDRELSSLRGP